MMDLSRTECLALLRLQIEWGADEALDMQPHDRLAPADTLAPTLGPTLVPTLGPTLGPARAPAPTLAASPSRAHPIAERTASPFVPSPQPAPLRGGTQQAEAEAAAAAANSLAALRTAVAAFRFCPLRDTASHTLFAEGDPDTGLLLIGEVPDADEDRAGFAFAGASGALLDRMLASIGLARSRMLIAPLIPWRPPGDRKPSPIEMAACLPFLYRLIALSRPRQLILMGARPTRTLLANETPLARLRGRWSEARIPALSEVGASQTLPALPMRHPAALLTTPSMRRDAWHDLLLLGSSLERKIETEA